MRAALLRNEALAVPAVRDQPREHRVRLGERFVAKKSGSHESDAQPTSLLSLMPLVLGELLPKDIRDKLALVLERDFLTDNGLATEMPQSPKYRPDGYWRGPIWAPSDQ